jgi:hypothetical protein
VSSANFLAVEIVIKFYFPIKKIEWAKLVASGTISVSRSWEIIIEALGMHKLTNVPLTVQNDGMKIIFQTLVVVHLAGTFNRFR